MVISCEIMKI